MKTPGSHPGGFLPTRPGIVLQPDDDARRDRLVTYVSGGGPRFPLVYRAPARVGNARVSMVALWFCLCLLLSSPVLSAQSLVVNPDVAQTDLSLSRARAIFGMRQPQWPDGSLVQVFVLDDKDPLHVAFSKKVLHVFPHQLRRAWDRLVFSGTGQAPHRVGSVEEMKQRVAKTPGAIGYLPEDEVDAGVRPVEIR